MALIDKNYITELVDASEVRQVAETAVNDIQLKSVAYAINSAANSGEYSVIFNEPLLPATKEALISKNYTIKDAGLADSAKPQLISWGE